ncbi:MAG: hypothetical protein AAB964_01645 [Patescibacteria group bacterium]
MKYLPCDQIAADTLETQRKVAKESGVPLSLSVTIVERMVSEVEEIYAAGTLDFAETLDVVLWKQEFRHDVERTAYHKVLELVFKRRAIHKQQENSRRGRYAPFTPF